MDSSDKCPRCNHLEARITALEQRLAAREHDLTESNNQSHRLSVKFLEASIKLWQHQKRLKEAEEKVITSEDRLRISQEEAKSREFSLKKSNRDLRASLDRKSITGRKALEKLTLLREELGTSKVQPWKQERHGKGVDLKGGEGLQAQMDDLCRDMALLAAIQHDSERAMKDREWLDIEMAKLLQMQAALAQSLDQLCIEAQATKEHNKQLVVDIETRDEAINKWRTKLDQEESRNVKLRKEVERLEMMLPLGWVVQRRGTLGWVGLTKKPSQVYLDSGLG
ncbi:hypothetical protein BGZ63DRAFT_395605 [Mariannaea sp. PMI_226]|nr:hypothetical protein BGZ63DRAFT_395605 [Mariannaea sp. PMI_226]